MLVSLERLLAWALVCLVAAGCGTDTAPPDSDPEVTLGTGATGFESLVDGDDIFIIQGPQGGFHFLGSVQVRGLEPGDPEDLSDPDNPTSEFRVLAGGARVDLRAASYTQGLDPASSEHTYEMIGRLVILDITADDQLADVEVVFEVEVRDSRGRSARDQRTLIAVPHPANL